MKYIKYVERDNLQNTKISEYFVSYLVKMFDRTFSVYVRQIKTLGLKICPLILG